MSKPHLHTHTNIVADSQPNNIADPQPNGVTDIVTNGFTNIVANNVSIRVAFRIPDGIAQCTADCFTIDATNNLVPNPRSRHACADDSAADYTIPD